MTPEERAKAIERHYKAAENHIHEIVALQGGGIPDLFWGRISSVKELQKRVFAAPIDVPKLPLCSCGQILGRMPHAENEAAKARCMSCGKIYYIQEDRTVVPV